MTNLEKLKLAAGWIETFGKAEQIGSIGISGERPAIHFREWRDFQAMFAGRPTKMNSYGNHCTHIVEMDGIDFVGLEYIERSSGRGVVPHVLTS